MIRVMASALCGGTDCPELSYAAQLLNVVKVVGWGAVVILAVMFIRRMKEYGLDSGSLAYLILGVLALLLSIMASF